MKLFLIEFVQKLIIKSGLFLKLKDALFSHPAEPLFRIKRILRNDNKKNLVLIDIGAADGMVSSYFSINFPFAKIISFEPNPVEFEKARQINRNYKNVEIRNLALGREEGHTQMHILDNSFSSSLLAPEKVISDTGMESKLKVKNIINVEVSTLDTQLYGIDVIDLIKIDTQGTELDILKGGIDTLKKTKYLLIEQNNNAFYKGGCQYYEVDEFLRINNFIMSDIYIIYRGKDNIKEFDALYRNISK